MLSDRSVYRTTWRVVWTRTSAETKTIAVTRFPILPETRVSGHVCFQVDSSQAGEGTLQDLVK